MIRDEKGITLIELLIVIVFIGVIGSVLATMIFTGVRSYDTASEQVESYFSGRWAFLNIEKQIKYSEKYFVKDGNVYLFDMENDNFLNYYTLENNTIMKHKINKDEVENENPREYVSQFADNIHEFKLEPVEDKDKLLRLVITSEVKGKKLELKSHIRIAWPYQ